MIDGKPLDAAHLKSKPSGITIERLFSNQKVSDLVAKAETEQNDYRRPIPVDVFFSPEKHYAFPYYSFHWRSPHLQRGTWVLTISVYTYSMTILVGSSLALLGLLHYVLKRQLRTRGMSRSA